MSERLSDKRTMRTKRIIRDSLTELMEEKGFDGITVRDLTAKAEINRGTFYIHYRDKFDLLEQSENEIFQELETIVQVVSQINPLEVMKHNLQNEPLPFLIKLFEYFQENSNFLKVILGPNGDASFQVRLKEFIKKSFLQHLVIKLNKEDMLVPVDFLIAYVSSAHLGVIQHWLETGMEKSPREMSLILAKMTFLGPAHVAGIKGPTSFI
ncbi:TetR/AcrR family transcriptional regulator [Neobacillus sp. D3-1R]|uniref:TetR/AcrR family transcriptional regulator n=1 Tax=Neobacillus sp. D3-1R TaxID=3445778 RepID=UPI003F9EF4C8